MLAELVHLCRHAPATLALKRKLPQAEFYAAVIARADAAGLADRRRALVADLTGRVVEIGCGTGAMFPHYGDGVRVTAIEPDPEFAAIARRAARAVADPERVIEVADGSGEALPLGDGEADAAVLALVLCSVPAMEPVLREVARVVRPGGAVRLLEHVRSPGRLAGRLMDLADPLWLRLNGQGCHLNRDPIAALERAGLVIEQARLVIEQIDAFQIWSPGLPAFPLRAIRAVRC